eukprot:gb/GECG01007567.1/.p1 GENE.gb/GECG01007567.1/~~gb/GECG01007567.1/.p1  ORF type:complete len:115 (+),score=7.62 gb/GECG01007567.1/:1-345(+)
MANLLLVYFTTTVAGGTSQSNIDSNGIRSCWQPGTSAFSFMIIRVRHSQSLEILGVHAVVDLSMAGTPNAGYGKSDGSPSEDNVKSSALAAYEAFQSILPQDVRGVGNFTFLGR